MENVQTVTHVKCINDGYLGTNDAKPSLELGKVYTLQEVNQCPLPCGEKHYDVGLTPNVHTVTCYKCHRTLPASGKIHWANSIRFE
jgi:hypothetical protein